MKAFQERLTRITSSGRFIPELDGLRAVAILAVLLLHLHQILTAQAHSIKGESFIVRVFIQYPVYGVELFFVISGFILALPFASHIISGDNPVKLGEYYKRRLTRLEPPYVLHLLLLAIVFLLLDHPLAEVARHFFASLFYVGNIVYGQFHPQSLNNVTWSLEIEIQFYLLAPLFSQVFRVHRRFREAVIVLVVLLVFGARKMIEWRYGPLPVTLLTYLPCFAAGYLLANRYTQDWHGSSPSRASGDVIALAAVASLLLLFQFNVPARSLVLVCVLYVGVGASLQANIIKRILASWSIRTIGGMCYSIYLLHLPLLYWLVPLIRIPVDANSLPGMLFAAIVYGVPVLAISSIFFVYVERPCMQRNWWRDMSFRFRSNAETGNT